MKKNNMKYDAIILLAGKGERFASEINKVYYRIYNKPVFKYSLEVFLNDDDCKKVILVYNKDDKELLENYLTEFNAKIILCQGGNERYLSVKEGLKKVTEENVLIHDGARPVIDINLIQSIKKELTFSKAVAPGLPITDTVKNYIEGEKVETIDRSHLYYMQTPQGVKTQILKDAFVEIKEDDNITDDLMAIEKYEKVLPKIIKGEKKNIKLTTIEDVLLIQLYLKERTKEMLRIGESRDIHKLIPGRKLIIGTIEIPHDKGFEAHSDGDILLHAITEAIIGALGLGDLGTHFPDNDMKYKNISSSFFLQKAKEMMDKEGYEVENIDSTVIIERPHLLKYIPQMRKNIASILNIKEQKVNIKATRGETLGYIGKEDGAEAMAIVLLKKIGY